jgi:hypothetical protein
VNRLGNLALLKTTENSVSGNAAFTAKRPVFKKSKFALTKMAASEVAWTVEAIEKRQKKLAGLAVTTWPLK